MKDKDYYEYCENFCPFYSAKRQYNRSHRHIICCPQEMCEAVVKVVMKNDEEFEKSRGDNKRKAVQNEESN